jgi:phosphatidylserine decarboxylase
VGAWLPQDHRIQKQWMDKTIRHVDNNPKDFHPVIKEFRHMIEGDTRLYLLFNSMFEQIPSKKPYSQDPVGHRQIRDYHHMLQLLNHLMSTPPAWSDHEHGVGLVGLPINALFDWPMATSSGFSVFLDPQVNVMLKKVLNTWGDYLKSPESATVLDDSSCGWFGPTGSEDLTKVANAAANTSRSFDTIFKCNPSAKYHGFMSWDNFFTREFREDARPIASPEDDSVIANACESLPYKVAHNVQYRDKFWIKGQSYSLVDMLAYDELAHQFLGGTVYRMCSHHNCVILCCVFIMRLLRHLADVTPHYV